MPNSYNGVTARFLNSNERLINTEEKEMPLVFEPQERKDLPFLQNFLSKNSEKLMEDVGKYGALLFRGFDIQSDKDFEQAIVSIQGIKGISDAFMAEHGRERVDGLKYVLHTNTIYKTGGTLYLGGFHSENYYTTDVSAFIAFCCLKPPILGGETGLINMEKVYDHLDDQLKSRLEEKPFFVDKWLVSDVAKRYQIDPKTVEKICKDFDLPLAGEGEDKLILMYKPSVFEHPVTKKKAFQINFFSLPSLDPALRKCFLKDYPGKNWFWHRLVWRMPLFKLIENLAVFLIAFAHSPKELYQITASKWKTEKAFKKLDTQAKKVDSCFSKKDIQQLARQMRNFYCSILWHKGDILLVDNRKVVHAGMPGSGSRVIRALIANPLQMKYSSTQPGFLQCRDSLKQSMGHYMTEAKTTIPDKSK